MFFRYEYRSNDGNMAKGRVEADSRANAFSKLKERGISPLRLEPESGSSKTGGACEGNRIRRRVLVWVGAAAAVLTILAVAWLAMRDSHSEKIPQTPKKSAPAPVQAPKLVRRDMPPQSGPKVPKVERMPAPEPLPVQTGPQILTNAQGKLYYYNSKKEKILLLAPPIDQEAVRKKSIFKHEGELVLGMFLNPGADIPPLPGHFTDEQAYEMLNDTIAIDREKDDEETIWKKQQVAALKEELRQYMKDGGTFMGYLKELSRRQERESNLVRESRKMIYETLEKGNVSEAKALLDALNKNLSESGIPGLRLPPKYRKMMEENQ